MQWEGLSLKQSPIMTISATLLLNNGGSTITENNDNRKNTGGSITPNSYKDTTSINYNSSDEDGNNTSRLPSLQARVYAKMGFPRQNYQEPS